MVPCDVIEANAIRDANDQSSLRGDKFIGFVTYFIESILSVGDVIDGGIY